jgi:hypothetical protein
MKRILRPILAAALVVAIAAGVLWTPSRPVEAANNIVTFDTTMTKYVQRGQSRAGLSRDVAVFWEDFVITTGASAAPGWTVSLGGSASFSELVNNTKGGVGVLASGATASTLGQLLSNSNAVGPTNTDRWYVAFRMAVTTAIDNQTKAAVGLQDVSGSAHTLLCGVFGPSSTANYVCQFDGDKTGTFVSTGFAIDTNFHVFEVYGQADAKLRVRVDGGAEAVSGTMSFNMATGNDANIIITNGTTAANRSMSVDWILMLSNRM